MKAIDVATKNHVPLEDIQEICKDLKISCDNDAVDIQENDVFLIERRIEVVKKKKQEEAEKAKKGKKLKLKKKVHVSNDIKKKKGIEVPDSKSQEQVSVSEKKPKQADSVVSQGTDKIVKDDSKQSEQKPPHTRPQSQGSRPDNRQGARPQSQGSRSDNRQGARPQGQGGRPDNRQGARPQGQGGRPDNRQGARPQGQGGRPDNRQGARPQGQGGRPDNRQGARPQGQGGRPDNRHGARPQGQGGRPSSAEEKPVSMEITDENKRKKVSNKVHEKGKEWLKSKKDRAIPEKDIAFKKKSSIEQRKSSIPDKISITENVTVGELAKKLNIKANEVIAKLMKLGVMVTINQAIDAESASILASEYGVEVKVVSLFDETVIKNEQTDNVEDYLSRPPVVTVMGHVDHGKTKLLDAIRDENVIDSEFGGITQHIGAYMVKAKGRDITFLDTPGHAAFTTMRARGTGVTDIVILVVAANDGVMPQTVEAINHAKAANVPIIVAINKIDLEDANPQKVRQELSGYELVPEEWGGSTLFAEISAKQKINIDELLDLVLIQSEMLELKANANLIARGTVIESKLDLGRGAVSTLLVQSGSLHVGDSFVVGVYSGKIRAMFDCHGKPIDVAGPSFPVEILGISGVPAAGDPFEGVESDRTAKMVSQKRLEYKRIESAKKVRKVTLESFNDMIKEGELQELAIIVKADVDGSAQALTEALEKLSNDEVKINVIHTGTGGINESDVMLASASNAVIIGYHVRPTGKVSDIAAKEDVSIKFYNIIFEATDNIKAAMEGMLAPIFEEKILGTGEIKQIFKVSKVGTIAGSICLSGKITRKAKVRLLRDGVVVFDGVFSSLKRFKDDVSVVEAGQECGFGLEGFNDIKEGDTFEAYEIIQIAKTL